MNIGIDLSAHNGKVEFDKVKSNGCKFAILRLGFGDDIPNQDDSTFLRNVNECEKYGIPWGAYLYSYASNFSHLISEINHTKRVLSGLKPTYPIFFDVEDEKTIGQLSPNTINSYISKYCTELEKAGYFAGWYANKNWYDNKISDAKKLAERFAFWFARPAVNKPEYAYGIWQAQTGETGGKFAGVKKWKIRYL